MPGPILAELPQSDALHTLVQSRISQTRKLELHSNYITFRSLQDYDQQAGGLSRFLSYIDTRPTKRLLEIGAGKGVAARQLREQGTNIITTGLLPYDEHGNLLPTNLAASRTTPDYLTMTETLDGVPPVDGVLAIHSLAYSYSPELAIRMIDRKLQPGGVMKALFLNKDNIAKLPRRELRAQHSYDLFARELQELGYDVAVKVNTLNEEQPVILLAVKPGEHTPKAVELLEEDFALCKQTHGDHIT